LKKRAQLQEFVARFSAGTRASQVQSRIKQLEKLSLADLKKSNIARPFIKFEQKRPSGKQTLTVEGLSKRFDKPLFTGFSGLITRSERVAGGRPQRGGQDHVDPHADRRVGAGRRQGRLGTRGADRLHAPGREADHPDQHHCFDYLHDIDPSAGNEEIAACWPDALPRRRRHEPTKALSGGEAVRLLFCKLMLVKPQRAGAGRVRPTTRPGVDSPPWGGGLASYAGTVIFVAHDRDLIDTVAHRILAFHHSGLEDFAGDYETFLERHGGFIDAH